MSDGSAFLYHIETYGELRPHLEREWLLTAGNGAFASGTLVGCNTRRYHGLLCAATLPPVGRMMTLSRVAETLEMLDGNPDKPPFELDVAQFGDNVSPRGDRFLRRFSLGDTARWDYDVADVHVEKEIQLIRGHNAVAVRYRVNPLLRGRVRLTLRPFVAMRDFHDLRTATDGTIETRDAGDAIALHDRGLRLNLRSDGLTFHAEPDWWFGHTYPLEAERGLPDAEDLFTPGRYEVELDTVAEVTLWAWVGDAPPGWDAGLLDRAGARERRRPMPTEAQQRLARSADDFVVRRSSPTRGSSTSILAGYPWFADWGRDTMIALPGLLLTTGRHHEAGQVLSLFAGYVDEGMIPNRFDDYTSEPSYNTVDASLWINLMGARDQARSQRKKEISDDCPKMRTLSGVTAVSFRLQW